MIVNDKITQHIEQLINEHPEFKKLYLNDATVHSWLKTAMTYENREYVGSAEEILVGIIVSLGRDKQAQFDRHLDHMKRCPMPPQVVRS